MTKPQNSKKIAGKIPLAFEERVLELSLENPDFGARRLMPLLQQENIRVSASSIYNILKRHDQQNRAKRLAKIKERSATQKRISKKPAARISDDTAEQIVEISLQHPQYGARRLLPLLKEKEIALSESAVYNILKRNGLQNREKRLLRIEEQQAGSTTKSLEKADQSLEIGKKEISPPTVAPDPASEEISLISGPLRVSPVLKAPARPRVQRSLLLTVLNIFLFALLVYFGFDTWQRFRNALVEPEAIAAITPITVKAIPQLEAVVRPPSDYRIIWERNLFNVSREESPIPTKEIAIEELSLAQKDLGLKLVGTAVADDPKMSRAFIDNGRTQKQEAYGEGDKAGEVLIKKVLRNKVIIATEKENLLLTVKFEDSGKNVKTPTYKEQTSGNFESRLQASMDERPRTNPWAFDIESEEIAATLMDTDQLLKELTLTPYMKDDQPTGFKIASIDSQSVLKKMGLENGDVISGVNDEAVTGPEQAADFFQKVAEGGEVKIKIKRRRRTRFISLNIE
jgi:general secretion pathway protein C